MNKSFLSVLAIALLLVPSCRNRQNSSETSASGEQEPAAEELLEKYAPDVKPGDEAFVFASKDIYGNDFSLASLRGKYVVLDFWASWCPDCVGDIPALKELQRMYGSKGVEFVSYSFDDSEEDWKAMLDKSGMPWTQVSDLIKWKENPVSAAYGIHWIPTSILIDPQGVVAGVAVNAETLEDLLKEL